MELQGQIDLFYYEKRSNKTQKKIIVLAWTASVV
jgi:hypothetical protein